MWVYSDNRAVYVGNQRIAADDQFTPADLTNAPLFWASAEFAYRDASGTVQAVNEDDPVELVIRPGDDPQSPSFRYATITGDSTPALRVDGNGRRWIKGGAVYLDFSSQVQLLLASGNVMVIAVSNLSSTSTILMPCGGDLNGGATATSWSDGNFYFSTDNQYGYLANSGPTGDILSVWSAEADGGGTYLAYYQGSGISKTALTLPGGPWTNDFFHWRLLMRRVSFGTPNYTDAANSVGEVLIFQPPPTATELSKLCGPNGYFHSKWGVSF